MICHSLPRRAKAQHVRSDDKTAVPVVTASVQMGTVAAGKAAKDFQSADTIVIQRVHWINVYAMCRVVYEVCSMN